MKKLVMLFVAAVALLFVVDATAVGYGCKSDIFKKKKEDTTTTETDKKKKTKKDN